MWRRSESLFYVCPEGYCERQLAYVRVHVHMIKTQMRSASTLAWFMLFVPLPVISVVRYYAPAHAYVHACILTGILWPMGPYIPH